MTSCFVQQLRVDGIPGKVCIEGGDSRTADIRKVMRKSVQVTAIDERSLRPRLVPRCLMSLWRRPCIECILASVIRPVGPAPGKTAHCDLRISCHSSFLAKLLR